RARALEGDAVGRRVRLPVVHGAVDVLVAREGPETALGVVVGGGLVTKTTIGRVGVLVDVVGERIVDEVAHARRYCRGDHDAQRTSFASHRSRYFTPSPPHPP